MSRLFVRNTVAIVIGAALSLRALATTVTIGASREMKTARRAMQITPGFCGI